MESTNEIGRSLLFKFAFTVRRSLDSSFTTVRVYVKAFMFDKTITSDNVSYVRFCISSESREFTLHHFVFRRIALCCV